MGALNFTRNGEPARIEINSPEADRLFALIRKFQRLEQSYPVAARVIEQTVDDILQEDGHAR